MRTGQKPASRTLKMCNGIRLGFYLIILQSARPADGRLITIQYQLNTSICPFNTFGTNFSSGISA